MKNFFTITPSVEGRIIVKNDLAMCFPAQMPIVPGHVLVSPIRPVKKFEELTSEEKEAIFDLTEKVKKALVKVFAAEGFNHAWNEEKVAGQSVDHFHLHVLPRKKGDTGITKYEPRDFLYRNAPVNEREASADRELADVSKLIREAMN